MTGQCRAEFYGGGTRCDLHRGHEGNHVRRGFAQWDESLSTYPAEVAPSGGLLDALVPESSKPPRPPWIDPRGCWAHCDPEGWHVPCAKNRAKESPDVGSTVGGRTVCAGSPRVCRNDLGALSMTHTPIIPVACRPDSDDAEFCATHKGGMFEPFEVECNESTDL